MAAYDATERAHGVFGVSAYGSTYPSGNSWRASPDGYYINYDDTGTGQFQSAALAVGDSSGSGSPGSNTFSIIARVRLTSSATGARAIYAGVTGSIEFRVATTGKVSLVKQQNVELGQSTGVVPLDRVCDVGVSYDGVLVKFYIDGIFSGSASGMQTFALNYQYYIGWAEGFTGSNAPISSHEKLRSGDRLYRCDVWNRVISDSEFRTWSENPWQLYQAPDEESFDIVPLVAPTVTGVYTLPAISGAFSSAYSTSGIRKASYLSTPSSSVGSLSGSPIRLLNNRRVYAQAYSSLGVNSSATKLVSARRVTAQSADQFKINSSNTKVLGNRLVSAQGSASYGFSSGLAKLLNSRLISAQGSTPYAVGGGATRLLSNRLVNAQSSSPMALNTGSIKLLNNRLVFAQTSGLPLNGNGNKLLSSRLINAQSGSSTLSGIASKLLNNKLVKAQAGSSTLTGVSSKLLNNKVARIQAVSSAFAGVSSKLLANRKVSLSAGTIPVIANPASLYLATQGVFNVSSGVFSVLSSNTGLKVSRALASGGVSYTLSPVNNKLVVARKLPSATSVYNVTNVASRLLAGRRLRSDTQSYSVFGQSILTRAFRRMSAAIDAYALSGSDSRLKLFLKLGIIGSNIYNAFGEVSSRVSRRLSASGRNLSYIGSTTAFLYTRVSTGFKKRFRNMFRSL
jgi:hypothetical protein